GRSSTRAATGWEGVRAERTRARHRLVKNDAETKKIGTRSLGFPQDLLRAPVSRRAHKRRRPGIVAGEPRHSKVHQFHAALIGDEYVPGLDVAMNHAFAVR